MVFRCNVCKKPTTNTLSCDKCNQLVVFYCNKECQQNDFENHKKYCGKKLLFGHQFTYINNFRVETYLLTNQLLLWGLEEKKYAWNGLKEGWESFTIDCESVEERFDILHELSENGDIDFEERNKQTEKFKVQIKREERECTDLLLYDKYEDFQW
jgi:hypothetical protein